ncbi:hypothetical protein ACI2VK_10040 [Ralstonia nicotianae]|uniref:hypothetical protein n=1 Tax=Ralstonia pseudosolanacearum TaxID=1310165 RepID=UPI001F33E6C8|nr:hypothetical protein [Ralstonia solanacearum]
MNPRRTLQLAAEYFGLLETLAHRGHGVALSSIYDTLKVVLPDHVRSPKEVADVLVTNGLLERSPEADGEWEIPPAVTDFVLHLAKRQRLMAPGELKGLLLDMDEDVYVLARLVGRREVSLVNTSALRLVTYLQRAQKLCTDHHAAVLLKVAEIKMREDKRPLRERYAFILSLYERHIKPMQGLVDRDGLLTKLLERLLNIIRDADWMSDGVVSTPVSRLRAHVLQLKRDSSEKFLESYNEVMPLYNKLRRDHELAAAVASMLDVAGRHGIGAWDFSRHMPTVYWTAENLFTDYALEDHVRGIQEYAEDEPEPLITLNSPGVPTAPDPMYMEEVIERLRHESPVPDVLRWLFEGYASQTETEILCAYQDISEHPELTTAHDDDEVEAIFGTVVYTYFPLRIERGSARQV